MVWQLNAKKKRLGPGTVRKQHSPRSKTLVKAGRGILTQSRGVTAERQEKTDLDLGPKWLFILVSEWGFLISMVNYTIWVHTVGIFDQVSVLALGGRLLNQFPKVYPSYHDIFGGKNVWSHAVISVMKYFHTQESDRPRLVRREHLRLKHPCFLTVQPPLSIIKPSIFWWLNHVKPDDYSNMFDG